MHPTHAHFHLEKSRRNRLGEMCSLGTEVRPDELARFLSNALVRARVAVLVFQGARAEVLVSTPRNCINSRRRRQTAAAAEMRNRLCRSVQKA